jgi:hypothetical protein
LHLYSWHFTASASLDCPSKASCLAAIYLGAGTFAACSRKRTIWTAYLPADGNRAAYVGTRDFGTSPIFVQLSDKPLLASALVCGVSEPEAQWQVEKYALAIAAWPRPV